MIELVGSLERFVRNFRKCLLYIYIYIHRERERELSKEMLVKAWSGWKPYIKHLKVDIIAILISHNKRGVNSTTKMN